MELNFSIGEEVWINISSFMPKSTLDDDGKFWCSGTVVGFTAKRVIAENDVRGVGYYKPENIKKI